MQFFRKHWFLTTLVLSLVLGYQFANHFETIVGLSWLKWSIVSVAMFFMAWPLSFGSLKRTVQSPLAPLLACSMNLIAIPLMVWPLVKLAGAELGPGMIVAAATPCTMASAAVWTRRAGGNDSAAIMVTILTNATCFLVMPFWIYVQTGNSIDNSILTGTIYKLFFFVVLPIALAQLIRVNQSSAQWATRNKPLLSTLAMCLILSMIFIGAASMGLRMQTQETPLTMQAIGFAVALLTMVHCAVFWLGIWIAAQLKVNRADQIAVGFAGSQKTLMIGLSVAISLGMSIIPIVAYHAIQLIVDTVFADQIRLRDAAGSGKPETIEAIDAGK